jgi:hypothetical protein
MKLVVLFLVLIYTRVVLTQHTSITALGVPLIGQASKNQFIYYQVQISTLLADMKQTDKLSFALTPFAGDADLYISPTAFPTSTNCPDCIMKSSTPHEEIKILDRDDPQWPTTDYFYVGVFGYSKTKFSFNIFISYSTNVTLLPQTPQQIKANWAYTSYFQFKLPDSVNFTISLTPKSFDADLYITTDSNQRPSRLNYQWKGSKFGYDVIEISTTDPNYIGKAGIYYIAVNSFASLFSQNIITIHATLQDHYTLLMEGVPISDTVTQIRLKYYTFEILEQQRIQIGAIPLSSGSDPDLFITRNITAMPPGPKNCEWCGYHIGSDTITIDNAEKGLYFIAILGFSSITQYQILVSTAMQSTDLTAGIPITGQLSANQYQYFMYFRGDKSVVTISVTPTTGTVELYASRTETKPDNTKYELRGTPNGAQRVIRLPETNRLDTYFFAVQATTASNYTMLVSSNQSYVLLLDGSVRYYQVVTNGFYKYFIFDVPEGKENRDISITVAPTIGEADIFVDTQIQYPTSSNFTWKSENYQADTVNIDANDEKRIGKKRFYIGVKGLGSEGDESAFNIVASFSDTIIELQDGQPVRSSIQRGKYRFFKYSITSATFFGPIRVTVTSQGKTKIYGDISPNTKPTYLNHQYASVTYGQEYVVNYHFD